MTGTTTRVPGGTLVGQRVRRKQGDLVLTGRGGYLEDLDLPEMLHAPLLRSSEPRARLVGIDTAAARTMPGVRYIMTGAEALDHVGVIPHFFDPAVVGARTMEFRCLAVEEVRHEGEA